MLSRYARRQVFASEWPSWLLHDPHWRFVFTLCAPSWCAHMWLIETGKWVVYSMYTNTSVWCIWTSSKHKHALPRDFVCIACVAGSKYYLTLLQCKNLKTQIWDFSVYSRSIEEQVERNTEGQDKQYAKSADKENAVAAAKVLKEVLKIYEHSADGAYGTFGSLAFWVMRPCKSWVMCLLRGRQLVYWCFLYFVLFFVFFIFIAWWV